MLSPYYDRYEAKMYIKFLNTLWWQFMPGATIKVRWPVGWTEPQPAPGGGFIQIESADPNDHYRPWMEANVGKQGWDWDWTMMGNDVAENKLTIKFRNAKKAYASIAALRWT